MLKELIERIFKTQLALKIWINTFFLTLVVLLITGIAFNSYFSVYKMTTSIAAAKNDTQYVADSFSSAYQDIMMRFVHISVDENFKSALKMIMYSTPKNYTQVNNSMQEIFTDYTAINHLINSAMIVRKGEDDSDTLFFFSYYSLMEKDIQTWDLGFDLSSKQGISVLPYSTKPFTNQKEVVPIVIPLYYNIADGMVLIPNYISDANFILYLFLDADALSEFFNLYCNDNVQGTLYLVNAKGENLSLSQKNIVNILAEDPENEQRIASLISKGNNYLKYNTSHYFVNQIGERDLYLVNIVPNTMFTGKSEQFHTGLILIGILSAFIITALSFMISMYVTKPLKKLMASVHAIEDGSYEGMATITTKDEIGQLNHSIDSMHNTIQQQFQTIIHEEHEKYEAKIQVLAEQINPHFIYNALEFINMEVLNEHMENASDMISSLGNYLRFNLVYADGQLTIAQEMDQIMMYMNIMNHRFNNSIQVKTYIGPDLKEQKILKSILQPLVENSIKHGFSLMMNYYTMVVPVIQISFTHEAQWIVLSVTDNGVGFDENEIKRMMLETPSEKGIRDHIGLNNVYQRLIAYYKLIDLSFSSVPFVENRITIRIPDTFFNILH